MIVTLAGHVDHGKTSLVRALTGVDTDRLQQEKERGLTIDLGFAYIDDGDIGFVDVPGHHKFIHNMVAGVARNQYALLVVAADDGPMPQTREHLQILSLVGVRGGVVALSKSDRVDAARIAEVTEQINALTAGTFLANAKVIATAIEDDVSIDELRNHLRAAAAEHQQTQAEQPFRLAIDRAFNVRGAGLVVTGTAHSGVVRRDDPLFHFPSGKQVRLRGLRVQDSEADTACEGDRCALNLTGLDLQDVKRGDWLGTLPHPQFTELSIELEVLADFPRRVRHWTPVHVYHATSHATGRIAFIDNTTLQPGETAIVDLVLDTPLAARHGDQLVIRDQSLDITLGGGRVIHGRTAAPRRRRAETRRSELTLFAADDPLQCLAGLLAQDVVAPDVFAEIWHMDIARAQTIAAQCDAVALEGRLVGKALVDRMRTYILEAIEAHQKQQPSSPGMRENEFVAVDPAIRQALLNQLVSEEKLVNEASYFKLPSHEAELPPELARTWERVRPELDVAQAPSTGDLAKSWRMPQAILERDLKELAKRGFVVHVAAHRYYLPDQLSSLASEVTQLADGKGFSVREFRDHTGIGRNVAIEVLEYFDRRGFTRRQDNERVVLRDAL